MFKIYSQQLSYTSHSSVNYSYHAVPYIPSTYLSYKWKTPPLWQKVKKN